MHEIILSTGWQLKQRYQGMPLEDLFGAAEGWVPASAPGTVHQDLIAAGLLPDPFEGLNEHAAQWVGDSDWLYRCAFDLPADLSAAEVALCCDGLDTFASVWLNGEHVLASDNMFVPQRVSVGALLKPGRNELRILFESAMRWGKDRESANGVLPVWNGDASRVYVRKAQYHYGWDWGPTLLTSGPWRPVRLEFYDARIADLHCPADVAEDLTHATLPVSVAVETQSSASLSVRLSLYAPDESLVAETSVPVMDGIATYSFSVAEPQLWWPNGHGPQQFYRLAAALEGAGSNLDQCEVRLGLRRLRLVQEPLHSEPGTTFMFEVNGQPLFCGGANWIPADSFTPRLTRDQYADLLQQAADANMLMLRIWGGGIYEDPAFYELCDDLGLLVWQDFMFACGIYPAKDWFQQSVRAEAEAQVRRLRHYACIALWCGNNEDYQIAASVGVYHPDTEPSADSGFPARVIYERLLPEVCEALDPTRSYWPGSPYVGANGNDPTIGDRHVWDVWHGAVANYRDYPKYAGRFVSEFGMQAAPDLATIEAFTLPAERFPESRTMEHHNKATDGPRRLAVYLSDTVRMPGDLEGYVYATQLVQAEAVAAAFRGWRRRWGGPGRYAVSGALVWQLNDCWPVTSWAVVDYYHRSKAAYYVIRRELAPLAVGLARAEDDAAVWAINATAAPVDAELELRAWTLMGDPVGAERLTFTLQPNQTTELGSFGFDPGRALVVGARLFVNGKVVARASLWPEPLKYYVLPDPLIILDQTDETMSLRVMRPAKGVLLSAGDGVRWSDNMLDLMPDDEQVITARGLGDQALQLRWLGM